MPGEQTAHPDDRLAALRQEIRRPGTDTGRLRNLLTAGGCLAVALILGFALSALCWRDAWGPLVIAIWLLIGLTPALLIGRALASALAERYREAYRTRLRRLLAPMSPAERSAVLRPLERVGEDDTYAILAPLLREFSLTTEVTPAAAPDARGHEASPAENAP